MNEIIIESNTILILQWSYGTKVYGDRTIKNEKPIVVTRSTNFLSFCEEFYKSECPLIPMFRDFLIKQNFIYDLHHFLMDSNNTISNFEQKTLYIGHNKVNYEQFSIY